MQPCKISQIFKWIALQEADVWVGEYKLLYSEQVKKISIMDHWQVVVAKVPA